MCENYQNISIMTVDEEGNQEWRLNGQLHRDNDLPAIIYENGERVWYQNGLLHRDNDLPACIYLNGNQFWYKENAWRAVFLA